MSNIDPQKIIKSNEREIKKLSKQVKEKKTELAKKRERNHEEIERMKYTLAVLRQDINQKKAFIEQRRRDWEADGCPEFDPKKEQMNNNNNDDEDDGCIANIFCGMPDGKRVMVEFGDTQVYPFPLKTRF